MLLESRNNEKIKCYKKLLSNRKFRDEMGLFCLEGVRLIQDAAESGAVFSAIFVTPACEEKYAGFIKKYREKIAVYEIGDRLASELSEVEKPQGMFAIVKKSEAKAATNKRSIVLCNLQDPGNLGSVLRCSDAFGLDAVYLHRCCDLYNPKTIRASMGALFHLPCEIVDSLDDLFAQFERQNVQTVATVPNREAVSFREVDFSKPTALFIGNEGNGLEPEVIRRCEKVCTIPMKGRAESLNAAAAAAILIYAVWGEV